MIDYLVLCPFTRRYVGANNHILLRVNEEHAAASVKAAQRRDHPAWSLAGGRIREGVKGQPIVERAMPTARAASLRPQPASRFSRSGIAIAGDC